MVTQLPYRKFARLGVLVGVVALLVVGMTSIDPATPATAQGGSCPAVVDDALRIVGSSCAVVGLNEACYGHTLVSATFRDPAASSPFNVAGDTAQLIALDALVTEPVNVATGDWGVALLKVQAETPTGGEQTLTMMMFGATELGGIEAGGEAGCNLQTRTGNVNIRSGPGEGYGVIDVLRPGMTAIATGHNLSGGWVRVQYQGTVGWMWEPAVLTECPVDSLPAVDANDATVAVRAMSAFTMQSGDASACAEAPNGLLIQSPGGERARVVINGVEMEFASSAFLTAQPDDHLMIVGLEGEIAVTAFGETRTVTPGMETGIPLVGLEASGPPMDLQPVELDPNVLHLAENMVPDAVVNNDVLNIRSQPGEGAPIITSVERGTPLDILGRLPDNSWLNVRIPDGREGWVATYLLTINIDLATVPVINAQIIHPPIPPTFTPIPTAIPPTATQPLPPMSVSFHSDVTCVDPEHPCATISWAVEGIRAVFYNGQGVVGSGSRQECPTSPATYTLTVETVDGQTLSYNVSISYDSYSCYATEPPDEPYQEGTLPPLY